MRPKRKRTDQLLLTQYDGIGVVARRACEAEVGPVKLVAEKNLSGSVVQSCVERNKIVVCGRRQNKFLLSFSVLEPSLFFIMFVVQRRVRKE